MSNIVEYKDNIAFHPGYYVEEIIEDMSISQAEFALRMGTTSKTLSQLVNGQINISNDLAKKLSSMLGTSTDVWLNLQKRFDRESVEIQKEKDLDEQLDIVSLIEYGYFVDICRLEKTNDKKEQIVNLCKYFMIADLRILLESGFLVSFRNVENNDKRNIVNSKAWLQVALNLAKKVETKPYNYKKLKGYLQEFRDMTLEDPNIFLPKMRRMFSECGVIFVVIPHLKGSGINGAIKWINNERVVLALNNKDLYADKFWFSLFHEIKHIFQRKLKTVFTSFSNENDRLEEEANKFAKDYLIPEKELNKFLLNKEITKEEIKTFASSIGIHPGIVVGRLQHDGIIDKDCFNELKDLYMIEVH